MTVAIFRSRRAYQSVPADHPSVVALTARNPTLDPVAHKAMIDFCKGQDPLAGRTLLTSNVVNGEHDILAREDATGMLVAIGIDLSDPADPAFGAHSWNDIAVIGARYPFPDDVKPLVLAMADSPWSE